MFSLFEDVCFTVKSKSTVKYLLLTGKTLGKFRKTVYGKIFRKPFSKTRAPLSLSLLSLFLTVSALFLIVPTSATPCLARFPFPWSLLHSTAPLGLSLALADRRSPRCLPICRRSARSQPPIHWYSSSSRPSWCSSRQSACSQPPCCQSASSRLFLFFLFDFLFFSFFDIPC